MKGRRLACNFLHVFDLHIHSFESHSTPAQIHQQVKVLGYFLNQAVNLKVLNLKIARSSSRQRGGSFTDFFICLGLQLPKLSTLSLGDTQTTEQSMTSFLQGLGALLTSLELIDKSFAPCELRRPRGYWEPVLSYLSKNFSSLRRVLLTYLGYFTDSWTRTQLPDPYVRTAENVIIDGTELPPLDNKKPFKKNCG